jgi:hypothetical protein
MAEGRVLVPNNYGSLRPAPGFAAQCGYTVVLTGRSPR